MNYFDFVSRGTSWDVLPWKEIEVTEQTLTDEEIERWKNLTRESPQSGHFSSCAVWCSGQS